MAMASKKTKRTRKPAKGDDVVFRLSSEEATLAKKPLYNGFAGGYGAHGDKKYNRKKDKRAWKREINES